MLSAIVTIYLVVVHNENTVISLISLLIIHILYIHTYICYLSQ